MNFALFLLLLLAAGQAGAQVITTVAGNGNEGYSGDGGPATGASFTDIRGLATDEFGNLYIADGGAHVIRKVSTNGTIITIAGKGTEGSTGDGGPALSAQLSRPSGIVVGPTGLIYIADEGNNVVRRVDLAGIINKVAGTGDTGYSGNGGIANLATLAGPCALALDDTGNLYIAELKNSVIRKVRPSGAISTIAGDGTMGYSGDGGPATAAQLYAPTDIAIDRAGNIFIADAGNNRIRMVNTSGIISTMAGSDSTTYTGDGGPALECQLADPEGVALDSARNIYIADYYNDRIRKVNDANIISTVVGNGTSGYSGDGGSPLAAQIGGPRKIAFDRAGNMYLAGRLNPVVRKVSNISMVSGASAIAGTAATIHITPNPGPGIFDISGTLGTLQNGPVSLQVMDMLGQIVYTATVPVQGGNIHAHITLGSSLPNGTYVLRLQAAGEAGISRIVISR